MPHELDALFDARTHVGAAGQLVDNVLERAGRGETCTRSSLVKSP
jgi:hypothetical protein